MDEFEKVSIVDPMDSQPELAATAASSLTLELQHRFLAIQQRPTPSYSNEEEDLERACERAEARHRNGCRTSENWIAWGEALLGIAECHPNLYSKRLFLQDAIQKLEMGLSRDNNSPHANWCLGNAHVASGLASPTYALALEHYRMASRYLDKAIFLDPGNKKYKDSLYILERAQRGLGGIDARVGPGPESEIDIFKFSLLALCFFLGIEFIRKIKGRLN